MLNMTIEQFKEKLDELIDLHELILKKQNDIQCKADGTNILFYESETLLIFAHRNEISVSILRNDDEDEICRYRYKLRYRHVELVSYSTGIEHQLYKEGGLIS